MAAIAILSVVLLFMFRVVTWRKIQEQMEWGVILMYGGAIAMSSILNSTDAGKWFTTDLRCAALEFAVDSVIVLSLMTMALTEALSNCRSGGDRCPFGHVDRRHFGLDPKVVVYAVASASA